MNPLEFPILWKETALRPSDKVALQQTQNGRIIKKESIKKVRWNISQKHNYEVLLAKQ